DEGVPFNRITLFAGFAGPLPGGYNGDDRPAIGAKLSGPEGIAAGPDGSLYIADVINGRVRKVDGDGKIHTIYGPGADIRPVGLAMRANGHLLISDTYREQIVDVAPDGSGDHAIAGVRDAQGDGGEGEGGPATAAKLADVWRVAEAPDGSVYFTESTGN